jgi:hypothetical protein
MVDASKETAPVVIPISLQQHVHSTRLGFMSYMSSAAVRSGPDDCPLDPSHDDIVWFEQQPALLEDAAQADESFSIPDQEPWETLAALELGDESLFGQHDDAQRRSISTLSQPAAEGGVFYASRLPSEVVRRSDPDDCPLDPSHDAWLFGSTPNETSMHPFINARNWQATPALEDAAHADESFSYPVQEPWETVAPLELGGESLLDQHDDARQRSIAEGGIFSANWLPSEVTRTKRMRAIQMTSSFSYSEAISLQSNMSYSEARRKRRRAAQHNAP